MHFNVYLKGIDVKVLSSGVTTADGSQGIEPALYIATGRFNLSLHYTPLPPSSQQTKSSRKKQSLISSKRGGGGSGAPRSLAGFSVSNASASGLGKGDDVTHGGRLKEPPGLHSRRSSTFSKPGKLHRRRNSKLPGHHSHRAGAQAVLVEEEIETGPSRMRVSEVQTDVAIKVTFSGLLIRMSVPVSPDDAPIGLPFGGSGATSSGAPSMPQHVGLVDKQGSNLDGVDLLLDKVCCVRFTVVVTLDHEAVPVCKLSASVSYLLRSIRLCCLIIQSLLELSSNIEIALAFDVDFSRVVLDANVNKTMVWQHGALLDVVSNAL